MQNLRGDSMHRQHRNHRYREPDDEPASRILFGYLQQITDGDEKQCRRNEADEYPSRLPSGFAQQVEIVEPLVTHRRDGDHAGLKPLREHRGRARLGHAL